MEKRINKVIEIAKKHRHVTERCEALKNAGFQIKKVYLATTKLYSVTTMKRSKEIRVVIGRPSEHLCKEVLCVIFQPEQC